MVLLESSTPRELLAPDMTSPPKCTYPSGLVERHSMRLRSSEVHAHLIDQHRAGSGTHAHSDACEGNEAGAAVCGRPQPRDDLRAMRPRYQARPARTRSQTTGATG